MTVEVDDIREVLIGITDSLLPDATISFWIDIATDIVEANIGENVTDVQKDRAIKIGASYYSLQSYATYLQASAGRVPNNVVGQITEMSRAFSVLLSIISRAEGAMGPPSTIITTTKSKYDV